MTDNNRIAVFVFSYNRGRFLENCLNSILEFLPICPRFIVDDDSNDPDTKEVLGRFASDFVIETPDTDHAVEVKTGGLYGNMNHALRVAGQAGFRKALFIQDDMQVVRQVTERDYAIVDDYFAANVDAIQLVTTFVRALSAPRFIRETKLCQSETAYFRNPRAQRGKSNFSAIGVFDVERTSTKFGDFLPGEYRNSKKARSLGIRLGYSAFPFMNWTPYPTSFRGKRRRIAHKIMEFVGGSGFHPITSMEAAEVQRLLDRDPGQIPVMEEWLSAPTAPRHDIWSTGGGEYNMKARYRIIARAMSALRAIRHAKN